MSVRGDELIKFREWLKEQGWIQKPTKGEYEALRMVHKNSKHPLLVYFKKENLEPGLPIQFKDDAELTVFGFALALVKRYKNAQRNSV